MKRSSFLVLFIFALLFSALGTAEASVLKAEAVFGEPFGVCRIELPLSQTEKEIGKSYNNNYYYNYNDNYDAAFFEIINQTSVYESNKRALYPTWKINTEESNASGDKSILFLFQGQDELDVLLSKTGFETFQEKLKIKPVINEKLHEELIEEWWNTYIAKLTTLYRLDLYDPSAEIGIAAMMSRRLDLPLDYYRRMFNRYDNEFEDVFGFLLGTESIRLAMQTNTMLKIRDKDEIADEDLPEAASIPAMPVPQYNDSEVNVEPLAMRVPDECYYLRFGSFPDFLAAKDFLDRWGTVFRSVLSSRSVNYDVAKRIEKQLALYETILSRVFGDSVIEDVAIIGTDTFFREGAAIGILFQAKQNALLTRQLNSIRSDIKKNNPDVLESSETIDGHTVSLLSSPGNEVRSFYVTDGDFHLITTSKQIVQDFLATGKESKESLGSLKEFRYARSQINSSEKGIFIYLSDPFFRNLVSPAYRVEMTRRSQSVSEIQMLSLARLAAIQEGVASPSIESLIEKGFLPKGFGTRHDKTQPILDKDGAVTDSIRGAIGSFLPIPDVTIDKITSSEAEAYQYFANAYSGMWTNMDPVYGLLINERESEGEKIELKLSISPYARSRYGDFDGWLGAPSYNRISINSEDIINMEVQLSSRILDELLPLSLRIFGGLFDMDIPWEIKHGETNPSLMNLFGFSDAERYLRFYVGTVIPPIPLFDELYLRPFFGSMPKPNADGYSKTKAWYIDFWIRRFKSFFVLSNERGILESVTPNMHIEETDNPSQISLNLGDLSATRVGKLLRAESYANHRRTSAGNALLLHAYQQQLQPNSLNEALLAVQNHDLLCPLGGTYVSADIEQPDRFKSTAWTEETLYQTNQLPDTYRQTVIDELKSMRVEFSIDPDTLKTRLEIQTK